MKNKHSIENEPQYRPDPPKADPSEDKAAKKLSRAGASPAERLDSVHDEPAMFPGQEGKPIERDWSCSNCGYNLRGLRTGWRCPECGHVEVYHPPPEGAESYGRWLEEKTAQVTPGMSWSAVAMASAVAGPFAVLSALIIAPPGVWLTAVVAAPVFEEMLKIAALLWLIEVKPYLLRDRRQIYVVAVLSALVFGAIQNIVYQKFFIVAPAPEIMAWRWIVCMCLQVGCSVVAARGLITVWERIMAERRPAKRSPAIPMFTLAIVIHGGYNAAVFALDYAGFLF